MHSAFQDAGGIIGGPVGRQLGGLFNRGLYALTGFGDYQIRKNSLLETNGPPSVVNKGKEFIVRHREYITDVYTSPTNSANSPSPFNIQKYSLQPGDFSAFPWLSQIASKFQQYRVQGLVFEYKPMFSDAVVTQQGALGNVILATQYNAGQPAFLNKISMENTEFSQSCKPSQAVLHPIECARSQSVLSELYVRGGAVPATEDVKTYDFADFYIASVGVPTAAANTPINLGELWVSYEIALLKPVIASSAGTYVDSGWLHYTSTQTSASYSAVNAFGAAGAVPSASTSSNIEAVLATNGLTIRRQPVAMNYSVQIHWLDTAGGASGASWSAPVINASSGATTVSGFGPYSYMQIPAVPTTANGCYVGFVLSVPAATAANQYSGFTTTGFTVPAGLNIRYDVIVNAVPLVVN